MASDEVGKPASTATAACRVEPRPGSSATGLPRIGATAARARVEDLAEHEVAAVASAVVVEDFAAAVAADGAESLRQEK